MNPPQRRVSLVGPAILIGLGVLFLLNNLGILAWSVWEAIFRLWPILLIAAGLELIIGRRSAWGSLLALLLTLAVLGGALSLFAAGMGTRYPVAVEEVRQALEGAARAEITIAPAVGTLHIEALPESARLVEGEIRLGRGERLKRDFAVEDDTATLALRSEGAPFGPFIGGWGVDRAWRLGLNPKVPLQLAISLAMGESNIDLTGLTVSDLEVSMALGRTTLILPEKGRFTAKVESAIGQTTVIVPAGLAASIHVDTGLAHRELPDDYRRRDDFYTSPGYATAANRVDLEVSQAIGSVTVRQARTR